MRLPFLEIVKIALYSFLYAVIVFFMVQVAFAEVFMQTFATAVQARGLFVIVIFLGFLIGSICVLVATTTVGESLPQKPFLWLNVLALLSNIMIWVIISYINIIEMYPSVIPMPTSTNLWLGILERGGLYLISIPQVLTIFALYFVHDVFVFWIACIATYILIFVILLLFI